MALLAWAPAYFSMASRRRSDWRRVIAARMDGKVNGSSPSSILFLMMGSLLLLSVSFLVAVCALESIASLFLQSR